MTNLRNLALEEVLPSNLKEDPDFNAMAEALSVEIRSISAAVDEVLLLSNLDNLPELLIDLLAWIKRVDFYDNTLPLTKKRELVRLSDEFKRRKGTPWAVDQIVTAAFDESEVSEWFEYGGEPFHFKVTTTDRMTDGKRYNQIVQAINAVKNLRSRLESISIRRDNNMCLYFGGVVTTLKINTIRPAQEV